MVTELVAACAALAPLPALRCRCVDTPPLSSVAAVSRYVQPGHSAFVGRAISLRQVRDTFGFVDYATPTGFERGDPIMTDFIEFDVVVTASWGEAIPDTIHVRTPTQSAMCGADISVDATYLFLSYDRRGNTAMVNKCEPPILASRANDVMKFLDGAAPRMKRIIPPHLLDQREPDVRLEYLLPAGGLLSP